MCACVYVCMWVRYSWKLEVLDFMELELLVCVSHPTCKLWTKLRSSGRTESALNHWAIFPTWFSFWLDHLNIEKSEISCQLNSTVCMSVDTGWSTRQENTGDEKEERRLGPGEGQGIYLEKFPLLQFFLTTSPKHNTCSLSSVLSRLWYIYHIVDCTLLQTKQTQTRWNNKETTCISQLSVLTSEVFITNKFIFPGL